MVFNPSTRTQELILRHLPNPPATAIDAGGGAGVYACWLAALGYHVHRIDPVAKHGDQAFRASAAQPRHPSAAAEVWDGPYLKCAHSSADDPTIGSAVSLGLPAYRVLRPGGIVCGACIRGFASLLH